MQLTHTQIQETLARRPESRYKYFIRTVCAEEEVWGLLDDEGWLMLEDDEDGTDVIAVFPNAEFAEIFKGSGDYEEFRAEALDLYEFVDWLEDFEKEKMKIGVFPTPDFQCAVLLPDRVRQDIQKEFDKEME
jgi:Protein of unknown function (DUF2750)